MVSNAVDVGTRPTPAAGDAPPRHHRFAGVRGALTPSRVADGLVLAALLAVALLLERGFRRYWLDDPYISYRYAWNLLHGHGLTYNPGERVEGFSNPTWTLISAVAVAAHVDPLKATKLLGVVLHLATIAVVWHGVRRFRPHGSPVAPALAAGLVATSSWTALWTMSGLETPLYAFALVAAVVSYQHERRTLTAVLLLLAALTRIEGIAFGLAFAVVLLREAGAGRPARRPLLVLFGPYAAVLAARVLYYGHLLPNSYTDKTGVPFVESVRRGATYVLLAVQRSLRLAPMQGPVSDAAVVGTLVVVAVAALGLLAGLLLARSAARAAGWLAVATLAGVLAITTLGGGDWMPAGRFLVPALPITALLIGWGLARLTGLLRPRSWPRAAVAAGLAVVVGAGLSLVGRGQYEDVWRAIHRYQPPGSPAVDRNPNYLAMAGWLHANARSGDLVAIEEAGLIPYRTPELRYLDLFGLTDATLARAPGNPPFDKHDNSYVLAQRPRFLVIWGLPDGRGSFRYTHQLSLVRDPRFRRDYRPVLSARKEVRYTFIVFERRDG